MIAAIDAERVKLLSTRSPYWCVALVAVLGIGLAAVDGATSKGRTGSDPTQSALEALVGINIPGLLVLMIMAVLAVTNEYRFGTIRTSFQAIPKRQTVLLAKAAVFGALGFVVTLVLSVIGLAVARGLAGSASGIDFGAAGVLRQVWGTPVLAVCYVLIGIGVGAVVRHTAGAVGLLLVWNLALERLLSVLPTIGRHIAPFMPFANGSRLLDAGGSDVYPWGVYGSLVYFIVFTVVVLVIGVVVTERRDA